MSRYIQIFRDVIPDGVLTVLSAKYRREKEIEIVNFLDIEDDCSHILAAVAEMCLQEYSEKTNLPIDNLDFINYTATYYPEGTGKDYHYDAGKNKKGEVVSPVGLAGCLSDNYQNGKLVFPEQEVSLRINKGDLAIFPCNFCFPHYVEKIKGERIMVYPTFEYRG